MILYMTLQIQRVAKLQNRRFFPEDTFVHAKGLRIAVGICRDRTREAVGSEKLQAVSREVRCQEFIFFPYQIEGGRYGMLPTQASRKYFFYLDIRGVNLLDVGRWAPGN